MFEDLNSADIAGESDRKSKELLVVEVRFAHAVLTPFAVAVAAELEEFGLTKQKVDELMLRSAKRFGNIAENVSTHPAYQENDTVAEETAPDTSWSQSFSWFKNASGQVHEFMTGFIEKRGPKIAQTLNNVLVDVLEVAILNFIQGAARSSGKARPKPQQKSRH